MEVKKIEMENNMKKIIFIGPPEAGKTSIRLFFFENYPVVKILKLNSFEPTRGTNWYNYDTDDTTIGVVDTSGQEILNILEDEVLFQGTDSVIFMFDVSQYLESLIVKEEFTQYLLEIISSREIGEERYNIFVLVHKMDMIEDDLVDEIAEDIEKAIMNSIINKFGNNQNVRIYFTSLFPEPIEKTRRALEEIVLKS
ncbi:MAG: ADP-ribosylation factor-like protein [Promethearchaeota archaeon]